MDRVLRVLIVEDSQADAELAVRSLERGGVSVEWRLVDGRDDLSAELAAFMPDLVLSDYSLPGFSGPEALALVRELAPEVPIVFFSGAIGDERAVEMLRAGATDYVLKDRAVRLPDAVRRAVAEAAERRARREAERALIEANEGLERRVAGRTQELEAKRLAIAQLAEDLARERDLLDAIMDSTQAQLAYLDRDFNFVRVNRAYAEGCGYAAEDLVGRNHFELFPNEENEAAFRRVRDGRQALSFQARPFEFALEPERGRTYWDWTLTPLLDEFGDVRGLVLSLIDVTQRIAAAQERERMLGQLRADAEELSSANAQLQMQTTALASANQALEESNAELEEQKEELRIGAESLAETQDRFRLLSETAAALLRSDQPEGVIEQLCRRLMDHLECQIFLNYLLDDDSGRLRLNASGGVPDSRVLELSWLEPGAGACGWVAMTGEPLIGSRLSSGDDLRFELARSLGVRAYACHPVVVGGRPVGTLSFGSSERDSFRADEIELMRTVADQVATALERERLLAETERTAEERGRRLEQAHALIGLAERLLGERTVPEMLQRVADATRALTGGRLAIAGHDWSNGRFRVDAASRADGVVGCPSADCFAMMRGGVYQELLEGAPSIRLSSLELERHPRWLGPPEGHATLRGLLGARLVGADGAVKGLLMVSDKEGGEFTAEDEAALGQLAALASLALENLEARERAARRAEELDALMQAIPIAVYVSHDAACESITGNPAAYEMVRVPAGGNISKSAPPGEQPEYRVVRDGRELAPEELPMQRAARGEAVTGEEFSLVFADGTTRTILAHARTLTDAHGQPRGAVAGMADITELKHAQRLAEELAARDEAILSAITDGLVLFDTDGDLVHVNPSAVSFHRFSSEREFYRHLPDFANTFSLFSPDGTPVEYGDWPLARVLRGETFSDFEVRVRRGDTGEEWYGSYAGTLVRDAAGQPTLGVITIRETSERVRMEGELRESERRFRTLAETMPAIVWSAPHPSGLWDYINEAWYEFTGQPRDEGPEQGWRYLHPDDRDTTAQAWRSAVENGEPYVVEHRLRRHDGEYRWHLTRALPLRDQQGRVVRWFATTIDIDEQKSAEQQLARRVAERTSELERSEALLRKVLDTLPVGVWITDENGLILSGNPAGQRIWAGVANVTPDDYALYKGWWAATGEPIAQHEWALARAVRDGTASEREELEIECFDGTRKFVFNWAAPIHDAEGRLVAAIAVNEDVTGRVQAERALRQYVRRLQALHDIERGVLSAETIGAVGRTVVEHALTMIGCDRASVMLIDRDAGTMELIAVRSDRPTELPVGTRWSLEENGLPDRLVAGEAFLCDPSGLEDKASRMLAAEGIRSHLAVPLLADGQLLGSLNLATRAPDAFTADHVDVARELAAPLALGLQNARLMERLRVSRERLQQLSRRLVEVQEDERRSIARELHDEAGQTLTALMLGLGLLERESQGRTAAVERITELKRLTDATMEGLHRLAMNLRPAALDRLGLVAALKQYLESLRGRGLETDLIVQNFGDQRLGVELETTVFRVVQEALTNVVRHSAARRVGVILEQRDHQVVAIVEDDGRGFDVEAASRSGRLGLAGMHERIEMVGGTLTIESGSGMGTTVFVQIPLVAARASGDLTSA